MLRPPHEEVRNCLNMLRPPHEEVRNFFNHEYQMIGILQPKDDEFET